MVGVAGSSSSLFPAAFKLLRSWEHAVFLRSPFIGILEEALPLVKPHNSLLWYTLLSIKSHLFSIRPLARAVRGCLETKPLYEKRLCHIQGKAKNGLTGQSVS